MENFENLKSKIEPIFNSLRISYELLKLEDNDLNYSIRLQMGGKLKQLNSIPCVLYFHIHKPVMSLLVGNIYKVGTNENLLLLYEIINNMNSKIINGNFILLNDKEKQIFYRSSVDCGKDYSQLSPELIKMQLNIFIQALEELLDSLKSMERKRKS